jgi:hypothetical protein
LFVWVSGRVRWAGFADVLFRESRQRISSVRAGLKLCGLTVEFRMEASLALGME